MKESGEYLHDLDILNAKIQEDFSGLSEQELNWKPEPGKWSIGQCLDHLMMTNKSYDLTFKSILSRNYHPSLWTRISPFSNFFGKLMVRNLGPERRRRYKTSKPFEPTSSKIDAAIVSRLIEQNRNLKTNFENLIKSEAENLIISSPFRSFVTYKIKHAIPMIVRHQQRHVAQAGEVKALYKEFLNN